MSGRWDAAIDMLRGEASAIESLIKRNVPLVYPPDEMLDRAKNYRAAAALLGKDQKREIMPEARP